MKNKFLNEDVDKEINDCIDKQSLNTDYHEDIIQEVHQDINSSYKTTAFRRKTAVFAVAFLIMAVLTAGVFGSDFYWSGEDMLGKFNSDSFNY